jgi:hypothetical protein
MIIKLFPVYSRPYLKLLDIALMMEAASISETLVNFYHSIWHYNPEDSHLLTL